MSHFTSMKTCFQNIFYLKNALIKLKIPFETELKENLFKNNIQTELIIPQKNGHDIKFCWDNNEYNLIVDMSYWNQSYPIELFVDKITQQYANEVIIGESKKLGFKPVKYQKNEDGSNTLILERWNTNKS